MAKDDVEPKLDDRQRPLTDPPPVAELAELARHLAREAPETLPTLLWCVVRSSRVADACRRLKPTGAHLAAIQRAHPRGAALVDSFRAGRARLARWQTTATALDDLLPPIGDAAIPPFGDDRADD